MELETSRDAKGELSKYLYVQRISEIIWNYRDMCLEQWKRERAWAGWVSFSFDWLRTLNGGLHNFVAHLSQPLLPLPIINLRDGTTN